MKYSKKLLKLALGAAGLLVFTAGAIYFVRAFDARLLRDLAPEHQIEFAAEFRAADESDTDWNAYLAIEEALQAELERSIIDKNRSASIFDRYSAKSQLFPGSFDRNWNFSFEMHAETPRGVAVLLHGLTDSPYSMRSTAGLLVGQGFSVVVPRMPGHGLAVGGLKNVDWEDWAAVVRVAIRHATDLPGGDQSLVIVGYSNGGLLALDYALTCGDDETLPCPDSMIMMSPAISMTPAAAVANWHSAVSWHPYFEKFAWFSVLPEVDPFKYTSFPKRAGWEIYQLAQRMDELIRDPVRMANLPPILTFQSVVDNTVSAIAIVDVLYSRLTPGTSSLVVYDVNRTDTAIHLMSETDRNPSDFFRDRAPLGYAVSVLRNRSHESAGIDVYSLLPGRHEYEVSTTALAWPKQTYSLSHIALPFRPDDPLYGHALATDEDVSRIVLGSMQPRGEAGVLRLTAEYFLRARSNPFFEYQAAAIEEWLADN